MFDAHRPTSLLVPRGYNERLARFWLYHLIHYCIRKGPEYQDGSQLYFSFTKDQINQFNMAHRKALMPIIDIELKLVPGVPDYNSLDSGLFVLYLVKTMGLHCVKSKNLEATYEYAFRSDEINDDTKKSQLREEIEDSLKWLSVKRRQVYSKLFGLSGADNFNRTWEWDNIVGRMQRAIRWAILLPVAGVTIALISSVIEFYVFESGDVPYV